MILLDSSVLVDHLRDNVVATGLLARLTREREAVGASEIVRFEVLSGARAPETRAIEMVLRGLIWFPIDESSRGPPPPWLERFAGDTPASTRPTT